MTFGRNKAGIIRRVYVLGRVDGRRLTLHGFILGERNSLDIDHRNGSGLDNRRSNLRLATRTQNCGNAQPKGGVSRFKGVTFRKKKGTWIARVQFKKSRIYLGDFEKEEDAARAYDKAAIQLFGEFARLNFPDCPAQ
jgi:hypothetical protein